MWSDLVDSHVDLENAVAAGVAASSRIDHPLVEDEEKKAVNMM
jgi:hypothetical protein